MELGRSLAARFEGLRQRRATAAVEAERERQRVRNIMLDRDENRFRVIRRDMPRALRHLLEATLTTLTPFVLASLAIGAVAPPPIEVNWTPGTRVSGGSYQVVARPDYANRAITLFNLVSLFAIPRDIQLEFDTLQQGAIRRWTVDGLIQMYREWAQRNRIRPAPVEDLPVEGDELEELRELDMLPVPSPSDLASGAARPYFAPETDESLPAPPPPPVDMDAPPLAPGMYAPRPREDTVEESREEL